MSAIKTYQLLNDPDKLFIIQYLDIILTAGRRGSLRDAMTRRGFPFVGLAELMEEQLKRERFWEIDEEFMREVETQYLVGKAMLIMDGMVKK